jgi:coenzyme F420-dependent glucose-6-phosphate dehydrogenase
MTRISYHASHEQFSPGQLLRLVQRAERAGFGGGMSSDHFQPWSDQQGQSGFAWSWLGAAMQATALPFGVVNAPGQRYHPAIIAQAAATLAEMFRDRFWVALGSGQLVNEAITGERWPAKAERNARLAECVDVIRALWRGETVTHRGLVVVDEARLWTLPPRPPRIVGAALTPPTANWVGGWADALITTWRPRRELEAMVEAFRRGGGDGKPLLLKIQISYDVDEHSARSGAWDQWRSTVTPPAVLEDLRSVAQLDALGDLLDPARLDDAVLVSADPARHAACLAEIAELGFEEIVVHNVNRSQERFIDVFGERVLPQLAGQERHR